MIPISKRSLMSGIMLLSFAFLSWYGIGCGSEEALEGEEPVATTRWEYPDPGAPENWGSLTDEFRTCEAGVEQSPVNLAGYALSDAAPPAFSYASAATAARNNGHAVYLDYGGEDFVEVDRQRYQLEGIHSHSPGEHLLDGEQFAAELHLVHQNRDGNLAVVGLLFRLGEHSPLVQKLLDAAPDVGVSVDLSAGPFAADYVPDNLNHYGYDGSLTTPPCTEGVRWIVMRHISTVSQEQANELRKLSGGPNSRSVQPLGDRHIFATTSLDR